MENSLTWDAEYKVIATMLKYPEHQAMMLSNLKPDYFQNTELKEMYLILIDTREKIKTSVTLDVFLLNVSKFKENSKTIITLDSLTDLATHYNHYLWFDNYLTLMKDSYLRRKIKETINSLKFSAKTDDIDDILELCKELNKEISIKEDDISLEEIIKRNKEKAFSISIGEIKPSLLYSGYKYLDFCTQGWAKGELIVISARTGMGKTRFATNLIYKICTCRLNKNEGVYFFSLEESAEKIANMLVAKKTGINSRRMKSYNLGDRLNDYLNVEIDCNLFINTSRHEADLKKIRYAIENNISKGVDNYFIDTLNSMKRNSKLSEKEALDNASRELKDMAVQYGVRIFILAQNNREADKRAGADRTPNKSDVKGSDEIVHHADSMISLFKPAYYDKEIINTNEDVYKVNVSKTRDGTETVLTYKYDLGTINFEEVENKYLDNLILMDDLAIIKRR